MPKENKKTESEKFKEDILKLLGQNPQETEKLQCETDYSIDQAVGQTTLRMNCEGCSHKSSFSDASCRKQVISKIAERKTFFSSTTPRAAPTIATANTQKAITCPMSSHQLTAFVLAIWPRFPGCNSRSVWTFRSLVCLPS